MMTMDPEKVVCIDPGHGGKRDGAKYKMLAEDDLNLQIGYTVYDALRLAGIPTFMTRQLDIELGPTLQKDLRYRVDLANKGGANLYVSIHCDAFHDTTADGMSIHIHPGASKITRLYAEMLSSGLQHFFPKRRHRGIKESDFYVLRHTKMPAVLIECEFLSNPKVQEWLREPSSLRDIALTIATVTEEFCRERDDRNADDRQGKRG